MGSSSVGTATMPAKEQPGLLNTLESTQVMEKGWVWLFFGGRRGAEEGMLICLRNSSHSLKMKVDRRLESMGKLVHFYKAVA